MPKKKTLFDDGYFAFPLFELAIVKGLVEHNDPTAYFGSLGGFGVHCASAVRKEWVTLPTPYRPELTPVGSKIYEAMQLSSLPNQQLSRASLWNWDHIRKLYREANG